MKTKYLKAFTLLELLVSIAILFLLLLTATWHWSTFSKEQALSKDRLGLTSLLEEAKSLSQSSKSNSVFGVNISSSTALVFQGSLYTGANPIITTYNFNALVQAYSISLLGGGNSIYFSRLYGTTTQAGSIKLSMINDATSSTTITIFESGVVQ